MQILAFTLVVKLLGFGMFEVELLGLSTTVRRISYFYRGDSEVGSDIPKYSVTQRWKLMGGKEGREWWNKE